MFPVLNDLQSKKRGRPCAIERYNNELMQQKLKSLINSNMPSNEFAKNNIMPFIVKRQRRSRANDRERNRMQTLNGALSVLKQHLPLELLVNESTSDLDASGSTEDSKKNKKGKGEDKLTKIDTLKLATRYISLLSSMLRDDQDGSVCTVSSSSSPVSTYTYHDQTYRQLSTQADLVHSSNQNMTNSNYYLNCFNSNSNQPQNIEYLNSSNKASHFYSSNYQEHHFNYNSSSSNNINNCDNHQQLNNNYSNLISSNNFKYF